MNDPVQTKKGFLDRRITLRWLLILVALVILAALVLWVVQTMACRTLRSGQEETLASQAKESAEAVAMTVATFGNRQIVAGNWEELQECADEVASRTRLAYIAIVTPDGLAQVHTDRSFRDKPFAAPDKDIGGTYHSSVPAMSRTARVGTVWVGVKPTGAATE